jgi:hypothetical protein
MLGQLAACSTWKVQELAPEQVIAQQSSEKVQMTKTDGRQLTVWDPQIVSDSLVGLTEPQDFVPAAGRTRPQKEPVSMPLGEIEHLAVLKTNSTAFAVGIVLVAGILIVSMAAACGSSEYLC